ncbi:uncharacterized protein LOC123271794 [Cotesia glomerata]|uniref:uncharacterized protein LOC123271794 n=1 Tax=Cotesia glomerata TaxID=32391 RepID=UPI001D015A85|nr:uncharacterized protein LOC123271794 [Cotesia glomerata]
MKKLLTICSIWILFTAKVDLLSIPFVSDIQDMVGLVIDISDIATGRHDLTAGNLFKKKTDATLVAVNQLSNQISELTQTINFKMDKIMTAVLEDVPRAIQLANLMRKLIDLTSRVNELYEDYIFYVKKSEMINQYTIEEFGRVVTSHKYGDIPDLLTQTYHLFLPGPLAQKDQSILQVMVSSFQNVEEAERCNQFKTAQQHLYDIYETVIITEIKGYTMSAYAYGMLAIYHNSSFTTEIDRATYRTLQRCSQYLSSVYSALETLGREIFLCDPPEHIRGETHVELNSIRRIITHENMMIDTCHYRCADLGQRAYRQAFDYKMDNGDKYYWNPNQPCLGYMYNCNNLDSITFCEMPAESNQRYTWMETAQGVMYGYKDSCPNGNTKNLITYLNWYCYVQGRF